MQHACNLINYTLFICRQRLLANIAPTKRYLKIVDAPANLGNVIAFLGYSNYPFKRDDKKN